ncbi:N-acetylglucosamine-6-phosphate deacetylase [Jiangella ureilytica]|uniref:N-acetylglucosamine-6-phosphate deacetylase n=1 Tax=Jiangella ureilytica TaxID=2530374 RepID=A0A4R4RP68_9ACTN|nr:N-acetylglucosamine-6-phosphate deacetylase [Jiangella ureilytica]TDC51628.1 N-acetylglucosamine-6-phosphate deacetylase [Jiangella ureilytica]
MSVIAGARMVTPDGVVEHGWLRVDGGRIAALGHGPSPTPADRDLAGSWLIPGFVDMHTHGGGGGTVVGADPEAIHTFVATHRRHGTTSVVASLVSGEYDALERDVRALAELTDDGLLAGVHLEGPWISPARKGAHDERTLRAPEPAAVERLLTAGHGTVRMVTVAPELEHGLDAVRAVAAAGAVAAVGHTDATYDTARAAIDAGATVATHLFNAMAPVHHRDPGPIVALLEDERVTVELILDGVHLHPAVAGLVRSATASASGPGRVAFVTDAMDATDIGDGDYVLGGLAVRVEDGVARLVEGGSIAGSTLTMDRAFRFAVERAGFTVPEAVRASSAIPARLLGIDDRTGALAPGLDADLVVLAPDLTVEAVMARGEWSEA